jgi:phosphoglycolate phosphatase
MNYQAVLFDFDYTLGDSTGPIVACCTAAMTDMGWPAPEREAVRLTIGYTLEDGYTILTGDRDEERRHEFFLRFQAHARPVMARDTVLCPGAGEVLAWLKQTGVPTGIVSTKDSEAIEAIFRRQALRQTLALIVGGRDVKKAKPDPEGLHVAVERLGIDKSHILFCGDTVIDAETARRAGVDFCAVLNGTTAEPAFADYPHVHIAPDLHELLRWLQTAD